jgi:hypothetical protein
MGPNSLGDWLNTFRRLHSRAVRGQLTASEGVNYYRGRNELARLLFGLQQLTLQPGQVPRQWIRICQPVQVDVELDSTRVQALTVDLGVGGFGTILTQEPVINGTARYVLHLPSVEPLSGQATIMEAKPSDVGYRTAFSFHPLSDKERERLEFFIFDIVLERVT